MKQCFQIARSIASNFMPDFHRRGTVLIIIGQFGTQLAWYHLDMDLYNLMGPYNINDKEET